MAILSRPQCVNQFWLIINWTLGNKLDWNSNQNVIILFNKTYLKNIVFKLATILSWPECVDFSLTHWGRVTHICVAYLTIIASDNGLSPSRRQAIIWTNARILLIRPLGTNFSEIWIEIHTFSFKKMHLKMSSAKRRPFCLGLNVLRDILESHQLSHSGLPSDVLTTSTSENEITPFMTSHHTISNNPHIGYTSAFLYLKKSPIQHTVVYLQCFEQCINAFLIHI